MTTSPYLKKSLKWLEQVDNLLMYQLLKNQLLHLDFCSTQAKELNLKCVKDGQSYYYHSPLSARQEAEDWFKTLDLHVATVIFVYGVGLGYYYEAAKNWLKQHPQHTLIFLEDHLDVIYRLCETELGYQLLKDPQVRLVYFRNRQEDLLLFNELSWTYFESPFIVSFLKFYEKMRSAECAELAAFLLFDMKRKQAFVKEYLTFSLPFYRNFYANLLQLPFSYEGNALFNQFPQIPAIICGAGPSLNKNIDQLAALKDQTLLFAGGSALNALLHKEIVPHFGVALDPNQSQYARVAVTQSHAFPFFYRQRVYHEALEAIKGPRLYLSGAGGHQVAKWFEEQLGIEGESLDEGHNVVNLSIQIAKALGCHPIILVGVDLAFTNERYYADSVMENLQLTEADLPQTEHEDFKSIVREDIEGKPVRTLWQWVFESEWISEFARNHPEVKVINATEGGIGFKEISNLTLQEASEQFLKQPQKALIPYIDQLITQHSFAHLSQERIIELIHQLQDSLKTCEILFSRLLEALEELSTDIKKNVDFPTDLQTTEILILESDLETEIAYQYILETFHQVYVRARHRDRYELESKRRQSSKKMSLQKLNLRKQEIIFLRDAAQVNQELIQLALKK